MKIFLGIVFVLFAIAGIAFMHTSLNFITQTRTLDISGTGDCYENELKCANPNATKWKVTIIGRLTERSDSRIPDLITVGVLHFRDDDWKVYDNKLKYTQAFLGKVNLEEIELDPSTTYRIAVDTDPDNLDWNIIVTEKWTEKR